MVWQDNFQSYSRRTGGITPLDYAGGKGTWAPNGTWFANGVAPYDLGWYYPNDWVATPYPQIDWSSVDPTFPPLGMEDITSEGLILKSTSYYPAVRASFPPAVPASPSVDLFVGIPNNLTGGTWYNAGASMTVGSSVDGLPAAAVLAGGGNDYDAWATFVAGAATAGQSLHMVLKWNVGTAGSKGFMRVGDGTAGIKIYWSAGVVTSVVSDGNYVVGDLTNFTFATVSAHQEFSFDWAVKNNGSLDCAVGPGSTVAGQTIQVYDWTANTGPVTQKDRYLDALVSTLYSAKIKPPFVREIQIWVEPNSYSYPAIWGLNNKSAITFPSQGFNNNPTAPQAETDDLEIFTQQGGTDITNMSIHDDLVPSGQDTKTVAYNTGSTLFGKWLTIGVWVTANFRKFYFNGVLRATEPSVPAAASGLDSLMQTILSVRAGVPFLPFPDGFQGQELTMKVRSVKYFAPPSNTTGIFPPDPPVPVITWRPGYAGGNITGAAIGTVVADLTGAVSYTVMGNSGLPLEVFGGTTLRVKSTPVATRIWIQGLDSIGTPGIAPGVNLTA